MSAEPERDIMEAVLQPITSEGDPAGVLDTSDDVKTDLVVENSGPDVWQVPGKEMGEADSHQIPQPVQDLLHLGDDASVVTDGGGNSNAPKEILSQVDFISVFFAVRWDADCSFFQSNDAVDASSSHNPVASEDLRILADAGSVLDIVDTREDDQDVASAGAYSPPQTLPPADLDNMKSAEHPPTMVPEEIPSSAQVAGPVILDVRSFFIAIFGPVFISFFFQTPR